MPRRPSYVSDAAASNVLPAYVHAYNIVRYSWLHAGAARPPPPPPASPTVPGDVSIVTPAAPLSIGPSADPGDRDSPGQSGTPPPQLHPRAD